ncbi:MAG: cysteine--tRNA ligase [Gomphosphaeria aponina SAG 52.96 = DSM 107014]|uniref:Cysteine--tRNA ligase n=1 Tax=Gomphosphaeria aponina SAG 52.96 = DSM 107014 TaxID=1521640 RepID=A0A941GQ72_9CHRO|nr:cysteine--tRNA ligase [Gomphosphaeria aponina SAG 52.96 = DSM 107014]
MTLTIYNSLTRSKEPFIPIEADKVLMYCCGITVYDYCHLGHARTCLIWDVVRRYLEWLGYAVAYVQNFTDIDDKILNRARAEGTSMEAVADRFIEAYFEDMERLYVRQADAYPRATHTLDGIKRLVYELEQKGFAYEADGDVYYAVSSFPEYGKLSGRKLEDMQVGASGRLEEEEAARKKAPFDFALWKSSKPGEPAWHSPWGAGRPGWHIECSAMVREKLGETIDIHVGGSDLIFPHHENEIAQSEAATGKPLANYWLHNGMVKVEGEKMSKSLGNFITIRELLDKFHPMAVRLFILQAHYRKPVDFTDEALMAATNGWHTLEEGLLFGYNYGEKLGWNLSDFRSENLRDSLREEKFKTAVDDDFNFPAGLSILFEIAKDLRKEGNILLHQGKTETDLGELEKQWHTLIRLANVLGFVIEITEEVKEEESLSDEEIEALIVQRTAARKTKNFQESDRLRDELQAQGITIIDQAGGVTIWHR